MGKRVWISRVCDLGCPGFSIFEQQHRIRKYLITHKLKHQPKHLHLPHLLHHLHPFTSTSRTMNALRQSPFSGAALSILWRMVTNISNQRTIHLRATHRCASSSLPWPRPFPRTRRTCPWPGHRKGSPPSPPLSVSSPRTTNGARPSPSPPLKRPRRGITWRAPFGCTSPLESPPPPPRSCSRSTPPLPSWFGGIACSRLSRVRVWRRHKYTAK